jgi:hypothetical protein
MADGVLFQLYLNLAEPLAVLCSVVLLGARTDEGLIPQDVPHDRVVAAGVALQIQGPIDHRYEDTGL